jgi:hypothetical protein
VPLQRGNTSETLGAPGATSGSRATIRRSLPVCFGQHPRQHQKHTSYDGSRFDHNVAHLHICNKMKRAFADNDLRQPPPCSACCAKRRKTQCAPVVPPRTSSPPPFDPAPQTLALVDTPLLFTQQHNPKEVARSIQSWVEDCAATSSPEVMAAPPTPRSNAMNERGRRRTLTQKAVPANIPYTKHVPCRRFR